MWNDRHLRSRAQPRSIVGTGNPTPVLNGAVRVPATTAGPAASSRSIPTRGSWRGASRPRRTIRTTGTPRKCRCWSTRRSTAAPRKLLLQASRNGYFFVLDRTNGKNLLTTPFAAANWAKGIDEDGRPIPNPAKEPARDGRLVAPERGRRHQLPFAQLRSDDRPVHRQRAGRVRHLLLQAGARRVRLGGRRLRRLEQGRAARDRLPDRQDPLGARPIGGEGAPAS